MFKSRFRCRIVLPIGVVGTLAIGLFVAAEPAVSAGSAVSAATVSAAAMPAVAAMPAMAAMPAVSGATKPSVPHAIGREELTCSYVGSNMDDFLVHPGGVGASHEHDYFGARGVTANTTVDTIRGHGTSCPVADDESGYWAPSLSIGGTTYRPTAAHVYYERNTKLPVKEFPAGFHMIVGNAMQMTDGTNNPNIYFGCADSEDNRSTVVAVSTCKSGSSNTFAIWLNFPNCWDGKQSTGPSLNLVYATGSKARCPADHPVLLPSVHYTIWYDLPLSLSVKGVRLSSGPMGTAHADFVNGWVPAAMTKMVKCINTDTRTC